MNTVIRRCKKCKHEGDQEQSFIYLGDLVWRCRKCGSMYTEIADVIDNDKENHLTFNR